MSQHNEKPLCGKCSILRRRPLNWRLEEALVILRKIEWCLAMERLVLNVGEAATRLTPEVKQKLPQIPWPQIIAFRNRIVHGYDAVDYNRVWQILQKDIPQLIAELEKLDLPEFK